MQAWRAYKECLRSPLSEHGPAINAAPTPGDTGVSRYPPVEGERRSQSSVPGNGPVLDDTGRSTYPPVEGERRRSAPAPVPAPALPVPLPLLPEPDEPPLAGMTGQTGPLSGTGIDDVARVVDDDIARASVSQPTSALASLFPHQTFRIADATGLEPSQDTGLSRFPPVEGEREAPAPPALNTGPRFGQTGISTYPPVEGVRTPEGAPPANPSWYSAHAQSTVVTQAHNFFRSPYSGRNSLLQQEGPATSESATIFWAARVWETEHNDSQLVVNPEIAGGTGFSRTSGIAGFPNFEITRVGIPKPTPYLARLFLRTNFGLGDERENAADSVNQVAGQRDVNRLDVSIGKMAAPDVVDDNRYAKDPRTQFLNWGLAVNGAWDYPANVRGYTYGVAAHYITKDWTLAYGVFTVPAVANGAPFDWHLDKAQGQVAELEERYKLFGKDGETRFMVFLNHAHMGNYNEAIQLMPVDPDITKTRSYRYKYGFGISTDQVITDDIGFFGRLGWNDGHSESWAFTEIDRTLSFGLAMGGRKWCRPYDRIGIAGLFNGISGPHRDYLAHGGYGFIIGDGKLHYGLEQILETYYAMRIGTGIMLTFDFQEIVNPAYNMDRGPVSVVSLRAHWDH
jgi:high affinity Mn2+ porin